MARSDDSHKFDNYGLTKEQLEQKKKFDEALADINRNRYGNLNWAEPKIEGTP